MGDSAYRAAAEKCLRAAQEAGEPLSRRIRLSMAASWLDLARREEEHAAQTQRILRNYASGEPAPYIVRASHPQRGRFRAEIEIGHVARLTAENLRGLGYEVIVTGPDDQQARETFVGERGAEGAAP